MAVRLSVIMVHRPPLSMRPVTQDQASNRISPERMAEAVVGELIGLNGIDLMLVGPIAELPEASTDRLSLDSLTGDVAVLDWQSPSDILDSLASVRFEGERSPHAHDPDVSPPPSNRRRVYAFDLNKFARPGDVVEALVTLMTSRSVRTFTLQPMPSTAAGKTPPTPAKSTAASPITPSPPPLPPSPPTRADAEAVSGNSLDLDHLLDQLDQMDP